ncbi:MAG: hypothetical protein AB7K24_23660 [Gemmataceae bacterium]
MAGCLGLLMLVPGCMMHNRMAMLQIRHEPACVGREPGIVFIVDGAGDFLGTSIGLRKAAQQADFPLTLQTVEWHHGYCRVLADHLDREHMQVWGKKLADQLIATRWQVGPDVPIYVLAQSGGCPLVLLAADDLPAGCIDRVVMLAPPCSANADLSCLLACVRETVDVFYSPYDTFILGVCTKVFGTSDGLSDEPAGRVSFRQPVDEHAKPLYAKLRQHCWHPGMKKFGYDGRHLSCNKPDFLQNYVLPLLQKGGTIPDPPPEPDIIQVGKNAEVN